MELIKKHNFRASLYNALPLESVQVLVDAMQEFEEVRESARQELQLSI